MAAKYGFGILAIADDEPTTQRDAMHERRAEPRSESLSLAKGKGVG
jgi:hypothetical protein